MAAQRPFSKAEFYRYCRVIHGWLSAVAFLVLCLFSFTGLLLNHPEWLRGEPPPAVKETFALNPAVLEELAWADDPGRELARVAAQFTTLKGEYTGGNLVGPEIFARLQGVKGLTDLRANINTGELEVIIEPAPTLSILNELHRAERAGSAWRLLVDAVAVLLILLSLVGYVIFLGLRFRRRTALALTVASGLGLFALYHFTVF